ncbi:putative acetyltransferase [Actinoalloteichus hymeniacidonis]|uniref:Acetyltransferase n=1 Tax=Actinoalloteichus hymeniacidonis TaxID=340345 RepID=A0AAC9MXV1_9PSEU|nr:putative acetyltransferase [Actinoalloteichus hymeniacidonis]
MNVAAFETEEEADLVDALRADPAWRPGLSLVAVDDGDRIIGHVLLTRCHIDGEPALALAPVAVLPEQQGRGVGASMIRAALAAARAQGEGTVIVLGHPEYYPRFGFVPASRFGIRPPQDWPDEAFLALPLVENDSPPAGTVRYPAPFGID